MAETDSKGRAEKAVAKRGGWAPLLKFRMRWIDFQMNPCEDCTLAVAHNSVTSYEPVYSWILPLSGVTEKKMLKSPLKPRFLLCPHLRLSCLSQPDGTIKKWRGFKRERRAHFFLLSISSLVMPTLTTVLSLLKHTSAVVGTLLWLTAEFPRDTRASVWCCFFSQRTGAEGVDRISVRPAGPASMP
ncbi:uncharacterized protein LOC120587867 isoform X8 [Pteropus medius]|uniref:uncharacterized protein LOC120587867 isoform X8 n=1 Tax=Pteropus vampyrus TaxID=132908 RepID=UPI00196BAC6E|nr:uncharacterized protein LOC120587867 isoform X8 [Pteropus giganteus]